MAYGSTLRGIFGGGYRANGVTFDGTNDYLVRGADLTGNANGKELTLSFWVNSRTPAGSTVYGIQGTANDGVGSAFNVNWYDTTTLQIEATNTTPSTVLSVTFPVTRATWQHIMVSVDLTNTANRHVYVNGSASSPTWSVYSDSNMDFTRTDHYIGYSNNILNKFNGDLAEYWFNLGYMDLSIQANREKFIKSGQPVALGQTGAIPTGTSPIIYLSGQTDAWHTNKGTGGGFTENGALTTAATLPGL